MLPEDIERIRRGDSTQPFIRAALEKAGILPKLPNRHFTEQLQQYNITLADIIRALNDDDSEMNRYICRGLLLPIHLPEMSLARTPFPEALLDFLPKAMKYQVVSFNADKVHHLKKHWYPGVTIAQLCLATGRHPTRYLRIWQRGNIELAESHDTSK